MFNSLSDRLEGVFKKLRGQGRLSEENIKEAISGWLEVMNDKA